jgi:S1-C subfamily serine protease
MGRLILTLALVAGSMTGCGSNEQQENVQTVLDPADRAVLLETNGCGFASGRTGSGVAIGDDLVVTVAHLIVEAETVTAILNGQTHERVPALAVDRRLDLAVLRLPTEELPAIEMSSVQKGARGLIVGASTSGAVAFEVRGVVELMIEEVFGTSRHSRLGYELAATTADGDSGAGVYDENDNLIGIVFATGQDGTTTWVTASSEIEGFLSSVGPTDAYPLCRD